MGIKTNGHVGFCVSIFLLCSILAVDCTCTFPSYLTGVWYSSNGGTLTWDSTTFTNFKIASFGSYTFTCQMSTGTQYVSKSDVFYVFNLPFVAYICMDLRAISSGKYIYYQPTEQLKDAEYARMKIYLNNTVSVTDTATICDVTDYTPLMYHLLVKNNTIESQKIQCPNEFLGVFNYTYDTGSGNTCSGDTDLNVCDDTTKMKFDYSLCAQTQAFSSGGEVNCVYSSTSGTSTFLHVFNLDATTDESTYYRFTCYVIETLNNTVYATQYAQDCHYGQNATNVNTTGAYLTMDADYTCVASTEEVASAYIGIIIAVVVILLIIIIAILFLLYMWKKKKDEQKRKEEEEELRRLNARSIKEKKENPDLRPEMDLGLPDDSKYNIDRLMFSDDKMVAPTHLEIERLRAQGFEGYDNFDEDYMDDFTRQNMIDASVFLDKRQRLETVDELDVGEGHSATFMKRFKELARSRIKRKKRRGSKSKRKVKKDKDGNVIKTKKRLVLDLGTIEADDWESDDGEENAEEDGVNIPGQVDIPDEHTPPVNTTLHLPLTNRSIMADKRVAEAKKKKKKKKKKKDSYEDLVEEDEEPEPEIRLILPDLRPDFEDEDLRNKKNKGVLPPLQRKTSEVLSVPKSFSSIGKAKVNNWTGDKELDLPLYFEDPKLKDLPPLQRVHRKKNPKLWSDILAKYGGDLNLGGNSRMSENRWRMLLEELYTDKKYFDYMNKSARHNPAERDVVGEANEGLHYLQSRANFWKEQEPIPLRPPSWRSNSFTHSARANSSRAHQAKKSKSFVTSKSLIDDSGNTTSDWSSGENKMPKKKGNEIKRENSKLSKENSKLTRENSKLSRENSNLTKEKTYLPMDRPNLKRETSRLSSDKPSTSREKSDYSKPKIRREPSFMSDDSQARSPYDGSKQGTPRPKKVPLPKIDDADKIYKMDMLPKTPLTQVRLDISREESML